MICRIFRPLVAFALLAAPLFTLAADTVDKAVVERLSKALDSPAMHLKVKSVQASEIPGLYAVSFENGPLVYATEDGRYFVLGDLYEVSNGVYVNLADQRRNAERKEQIAQLDKSDMIVFSPEGETRGYITVFTDVTCFYCQKLHKEVPELNKRGVEVRYLAFPRAGVGSPAYHQLVTAWCSDNRQDTLTRLKNRESVPPVKCDDNPVAEEYALGQRLGVRGTPALITADGTMIPGFQTADQLMHTLGLE